jgi:hypothetical protein
MNYLVVIAKGIFLVTDATSMGDSWASEDEALYLAYALLCRSKGEKVTAEDVHDAWSLWATLHAPKHPSLVPFNELRPEVQAYDEKYRIAIAHVAKMQTQVMA